MAFIVERIYGNTKQADLNLIASVIERNLDNIKKAINDGATLLEVAYLINTDEKINEFLDSKLQNILMQKVDYDIIDVIMKIRSIVYIGRFSQYIREAYISLIKNNRYLCLYYLLVDLIKTYNFTGITKDIYDLAKSKSILSTMLIICADITHFKNEDIHFVLTLLENNIPDEIFQQHPKYIEISNLIIQHKKETNLYLINILPKEIIRLINNYQLI